MLIRQLAMPHTPLLMRYAALMMLLLLLMLMIAMPRLCVHAIY